MNGRRIGSVSLRLDAVYCAVAAAMVAGFSPLLADVLGVSVVPVLLVAAVVAVWAAALWVGTTRFGSAGSSLRPMLVAVMTANIVAAWAVGLLALVVPGVALSVFVAAVAVEVAAFVASQAVSLRAL